MKFGLAGLALVALAIGGNVHARIGAGVGVYDPEIFLAVWDGSGSTQNTILVDLGITARNFDGASDLSKGGIDLGIFGSDLTNVKYAVVSGGYSEDPLGLGVWYTSPSDVSTSIFQDPANAGTSILQNVQNINDLVNAPEHNSGDVGNHLQTTATSGVGSVAAGLTYGGFLLDFTGGDFSNSAAVGTAMAFFSSIVDVDTFEAATLAYAGSWLLDAAGMLTYSVEGVAPIPLPAGFWLLGSALVGLVGVSRRRRLAAAA